MTLLTTATVRFVALLLLLSVVVSLPKSGEMVEDISEVTEADGGDRV